MLVAAGSVAAASTVMRLFQFNILSHPTDSSGNYPWVEPAKKPEILSVVSHLGTYELLVTFNKGVFTNSDKTGAFQIVW